MSVLARIKKNSYVDSLILMRAASKVRESEGVHDVVIIMGTPQNKEIIIGTKLMTPEVEKAGVDDLIFTIDAETPERAAEALDDAEKAIFSPSSAAAATGESDMVRVRSLQGAVDVLSDANLALFSIPGPYVREEAMRALKRDLNLMIFSDNVPLEDEVLIKRTAQERGLLVMGPDCGTAIISGVALGFANHVRRGSVGIVGASGTGTQEVACLVDRLGCGISHAIGTGGRDIKAEVGGITMISGIELLMQDEDTQVIVVIGKPPEPSVTRHIMACLKDCPKPVIVHFQGGREEIVEGTAVRYAGSLAEAAALAVKCCGSGLDQDPGVEYDAGRLKQDMEALSPEQTLVRGVFVGGTFCGEAAGILLEEFGEVYTNTGYPGARTLSDGGLDTGHICIDMGEDEFTRGRPHPMLEPSVCRDRILEEADNPRTAVILLDVVLGYGVHDDPAAVLVPVLAKAREAAATQGRHFAVVVHVCGTDGDPQVRRAQVETLRAAGALIAQTNAGAARLATRIAKRQSVDE